MMKLIWPPQKHTAVETMLREVHINVQILSQKSLTDFQTFFQTDYSFSNEVYFVD